MPTEPGTAKYREWTAATLRLIGGTLAWVATLALAQFAPGLLWDERLTGLSWAALALNILAGVVWIVSFAFFLGAIDELERKIQLDALTVTLGAGFVCAMAYAAASGRGLVPDDLGIAHFAIFLAAVYLIAFVVGKIRYR